MAKTTKSSLVDDLEFVSDLCRFQESVLTEQQVRKKWHFLDDAAWERMGSDDRLVEAIELERVRRIRSGQAKREAAQRHVVRAPDILAGIMDDASANERHRIDACKALDDFADNGPQATPPPEMFNIVINLTAGGGDRLEFNKPIRPDPPRKTIEHDDDMPLLAAIAAKKDDGSGNPI
jgi:hypothetical protein